MIAGSNYPPMIYSLYCDEMWKWRVFYSSVMNGACFLSFIGSMVPFFDQPKFRTLRGTLFIIIGLMGLIPMIHMATGIDPRYLHHFDPTLYAVGGAFYIGGACIYMARIPERFFPRTFDILGHSH